MSDETSNLEVDVYGTEDLKNLFPSTSITFTPPRQ